MRNSRTPHLYHHQAAIANPNLPARSQKTRHIATGKPKVQPRPGVRARTQAPTRLSQRLFNEYHIS